MQSRLLAAVLTRSLLVVSPVVLGLLGASGCGQETTSNTPMPTGGEGGIPNLPAPDDGTPQSPEEDGGVDASDAPVTSSCSTSAPFGAPKPVEGLLPDVTDVALSPDELTVYFGTDNDGTVTLGMATRATRTSAFGDRIGDPHNPFDNVPQFSAIRNVPRMTSDGLTLYFTHEKGANLDVYESVRANTVDHFPMPTLKYADTADVYAGAHGTLWQSRRDKTTQRLHIYAATKDAGAAVTEINSSENDFRPVETDDGLTLYFASNRDGGPQVWFSTRADLSAPWGAPALLSEVNSADHANTPNWISPDGCRLYLTRVDAAKTPTILVAERGK